MDMGAPWKGRRRRNGKTMKNAPALSAGITQAQFVPMMSVIQQVWRDQRIQSPSESVDLVHIYRTAVPVQSEYDRDRQRELSGSNSDHEDNQDLPQGSLGLAKIYEGRISDQIDVYRVQHQLYRHQDENGTASRQHTIQPYREEGRCEDLEVR